MKISIDTKEDSHEEIKKVIKMLQNMVGDSQEVFSNQPAALNAAVNETEPASSQSAAEGTESAFNNIFGDSAAAPEPSQEPAQPQVEEAPQQAQKEESEEMSSSTEDLFAELFSEEELKKMDVAKIKEDEPEDIKPKGKKYSIELY